MKDKTLIYRYLKDQLSPIEEQKFRARVCTDKLFRQQVLVEVMIIKTFRELGKRRDQEIIQSIKGKLTWSQYVLIYGIYSNYYFTNNMSRYHSIFPQSRQHYV